MDTAAHPPVTGRARRTLTVVVVALVLAALAGAASSWPTGAGPELPPGGEARDASVARTTFGPCADTAPEAGIHCVRIEAVVDGGSRVALAEEPVDRAASLAPGDRIVVHRQVEDGEATYHLAGRERSAPLAGALVAVAVVVLAVARWRGLRMLAAVGASALVLVAFVVPAVLAGGEAVVIGLIGSVLLAVVWLFLGHGIDARTASALAGSTAGLAAAAVAATLLVEVAELAGLGTEPAVLDLTTGAVPLRGLLLAGLLVGTAGGLADSALRLVDATWDLRGTAAAAGWLGIARAGLRRGRAGLTSVSGTVVLAYAGAALPVFVLLSAGEQAVLDAGQGELVAVEVARVLVALLALAATAPLTALVAAAVVVGQRSRVATAGDPRRFRSRHERRLWEEGLG